MNSDENGILRDCRPDLREIYILFVCCGRAKRKRCVVRGGGWNGVVLFLQKNVSNVDACIHANRGKE